MQKIPALLGLIILSAQALHGGELPKVRFEEFASGYGSPLEMIPYHKGAEAFLVVDQRGVITFLGEKGGKPGEVFLDLRDRMVPLKEQYDERGVLGLALHPGFKGNGRFFVYYSAPLRKGGAEGYDHTSHLSEFRLRKGTRMADPGSERVLLEVDQPQWNHNGGKMLFGADGFLYLALGDGGAANDKAEGHEPEGNGQALGRLLGKVLRLDVNGAEPYGIPVDNPLVGKDGRDEIYAWGLRNPWGLTVDAGGDGEMILADVGQNRFEEIDVVVKGGNYGWPRYEGFAAFSAEQASAPVGDGAEPMSADVTPPVLAYPHNQGYGEAPAYGISITGGHVYRGGALPGLQGAYLFADYAMSWATNKHGLYAGVRDAEGRWSMQVLPGEKTPAGPDRRIVGFGRDTAGEQYVLTNEDSGPDKSKGAIWKIVPAKGE